GTLRYRGEELPIAWAPDLPRRVSVADGSVRLGGPPETQAARLKRWLEQEAQRLMAADLADYCGAAGVSLPQLRLTRAGRRWGSCSTKG
ncbi:YgjP-like metallopeptidase domain-containing protein, partial [Bilophila wadsworthia]|uniref:YgjP-like metallopeptidase domain-containing protein n=1 Tax=Bilophila wadsworthia TaxID=35833 RepID=UPI001EDBE4A2